MTAVHQFLPVLEPGAVGAHALAARTVFRDAGYDSEIFAGEIRASYAGEGAHDAASYGRRFRALPDDRLVYHLAIGSHLAETLAARAERLVVDYHNLTPLRYFDGWAPVAAGGVAWGRRQLSTLAARAALGIGDSYYNEVELIEANYARTTVVPILVPPAAFDVEPDTVTLARVRSYGAGAVWLFVGRLAPNKAQHDIVKAFSVYRKVHDPDARLVLVGGSSSDSYELALERFVERLGLTTAVELAGAVTPAALAAFYEAADVFVVCSDHEGFCVPLLEAWHHRVPIVAFAATAIPETLGDAGLLLDVKDPYTVAGAVDRVLRDDVVRHALVEAGLRRLHEFDIATTGAELVAAIEKVE
ncbi:MAG: glycosyltransferase [Actinomycetota bacterium]|nr:glycosyltransferase [Actinomycetota bacterium]